ncbi:glutathione-dependent formaldehyde-activating enzyme [Trichoderma parareesei]|uniref:Glutathione-dependent formaldehyde-activating enzyme n=1 Tax=Trichoderma parareesei TaxID=858221 RepID=A0A2H3A7I2_TRIPA|nr:glutathione-dependent formaldehyde-activating enzyme [Trichoderma parareesei]
MPRPEHFKVWTWVSWSGNRHSIFNSKVGAQYQPPEHKGDMPRIVEGGQLYTGSCHCGAVTVALSCRPLKESSVEGVVVCNCHICQRNAYVWLFPKAENMVLSGSKADIGRYAFSEGLTSKSFCRTCGVGMTFLMNQPVEDRDLAASESSCRAYREVNTSHPVNARVLHGVDVRKPR